MKPILEIKNISKKYSVSHQASPGYLSLRDSITNLFKFKSNSSQEDFMALDDVSFDINPGESIGIIGKNGAGKSTLLKILSKITPPTSGKIISRGRVASLLEVGTGFHYELSGRENIFLNGSILGMKRSEIINKFDDIVEFSGVSKFLDLPLKHYSSGMQVRLAFAVAAFLEPEVLVVDEVLAVGDAEFQKKCLGKMGDIANNNGRTVIFVSHQLGTVSSLCKKSVLLHKGQLIDYDQTDKIITKYNNQISQNSNFSRAHSDSSKSYNIEFLKVLKKSGTETSVFAHDEEIHLEIGIRCFQLRKGIDLCFAILNSHSRKIFTSNIQLDQYPVEEGNLTVRKVVIPPNILTPGFYSFFISIHQPFVRAIDEFNQVSSFTIFDNGSEYNSYEGKWFYGDVFVKCQWE